MGAPTEAAVCPPETIVPIPDELREPESTTQDTPKLELPGPIPVWNFKQSADCTATGALGDTVVVEAGAVSTVVYFTDVLSISAYVLNFIAKRKLEQHIGNLFHRGTLTENALRKLTGMKVSQARELIDVLRREQKNVDEAAKLHAESMLECYWENTPQEAQCVDDAVVHEGTYKGETAVFSYEVAAGTVRSQYSQEDADEKAMELAESMLNCFYINEEVEALCEERPDRPMDVMDPVPNDTEPVYEGRELRVGAVVVTSGMFISHLSQEEANELALAYGYSQLVCWYPNVEVTLECDDPNARGPYVDPDETDPAVADIVAKTRGQKVVIPSGFFISELSYEEATRLAEDYAQTLLECCYINKEIYLRCEEETVITFDDRVVTIAPHESSPMIEVYIPRGTFTSCYSQKEADDIAEQQSEGLLSCRYCNVGMPPACVPDWVLEGIEAGDITLPLKAGTICYNGECINTSDLPFGATQGIADCVIFNEDAQLAQEMANAVARLPITKSDDDASLYDCTYYNDKLVVACSSRDPYIEDHELQENAGITPDGEEYYFMSMYPPGTCISDSFSVPARNNVIVIPAGLWMGKGPDVKAELNAKAFEYATSILQCFLGNPETHAACSDITKFSGFCADAWKFGKNSGFAPDRLTPWSPSPEEYFILPRDFIVYRGKGDDIDTALSQVQGKVLDYLTGRLTCTYINDTQYGDCVGSRETETGQMDCFRRGGEPVIVDFTKYTIKGCSGGMVVRGMIVAESPAEADIRAKIMADNIVVQDTDTFTIYCVPECSSSSSSSDPGDDFPDIDHSSSSSSSSHGDDWDWDHSSSSSSSSSSSQPDSSSLPSHSSSSHSSSEDDPCGWWHCPYYLAQSEIQTAATFVPIPIMPVPNVEWVDDVEKEYATLTNEIEALTRELKTLL